ncbi:MAG: HAMP domain-containing histidine kinase [Gammaproteobacteria bacterium]|nr:HAMP domain-containing histidine kinase [Gammaproteobacteria bacterium]
MKATRVFQLTTLALVLVSVVQVGWWLLDQRTYTFEKVGAERTAYAEQARAAQALLDAGVPAERVRAMLPQVALQDGRAQLAPQVSARLLGEERSRYRMYASEGSFFLLALGLCIAVIARALRAEARVRAEQDSFLALVSHQFKTPLASLQLSLETLALRTPPPEQARVLTERMLADLARMELMVTQILESARLERGRVEFRTEALPLAPAVARVLAQLEERAQRAQVRISADLPPGLYVACDPLALDVVLRNVLENALAALAPVGGGQLTLQARALVGEVELAVKDTGVGFAEADQARLFQRFSRLRGGAADDYYGSGLGLFIVRRLMELAQGRVSAHSEGPGRGARFVLTWPAASAPAA